MEGGAIQPRSVLRLDRWAGYTVSVVLAAGVMAVAVIGALITNGGEGIGGLNIFVETLSGRTGSRVEGAVSFLPLGFAFFAGAVSAFNPCGFAMLPAYLGLYLGTDEEGAAQPPMVNRLGRALLVGASVTAGFAVMFGVVGAAISGGARPLVSFFPWIGLVIGVILVLVGTWLFRGGKMYTAFAQSLSSRMGDPNEMNPRGYFIFGISYGTASLSCTLPIFLAVIGITTLTAGNILSSIGQFLLFAFGMGLVIVVLTLLAALFKTAMLKGMRRIFPYIQPVSAGLMLIAGDYIVFYWLTIGGLLDRIG